jgi:hypothetical protein
MTVISVITVTPVGKPLTYAVFSMTINVTMT